jgi:hypothetical protein
MVIEKINQLEFYYDANKNEELLNRLYQMDANEVKEYFEQLMKFYEPYLIILEPNNFSEVLKIKRSCNYEKTTEYYKLFDFATSCYRAVATFPTDDRIKAFVELFSLHNVDLKWISNFKQLVEEIKKINESGEIFLKYHSVLLTYYSLYLPAKIRKDLVAAFKLTSKYDRKEINDFEKLVFKYFQNEKNRKASGRKGFPKSYEEDFAHIVKFVESTIQIKGYSSNDILRMEAQGRVEDLYIAPLFSMAISLKKKPLKDRDKYVLLFDLFRFIMKDKNWLSEAEFDIKPHKRDKKGNPIGIYNNSYRSYQINTMKKFIQKK